MRIILAFVSIFFYNLVLGQTYAIIADRLIDCKNEQSIDNPTIIVYKDKIVDVNFKNVIPDSATIINLKGYTVLPGLMDVHTHLFSNAEDYYKDLYENSTAYRALRAVSYLSISLQNGFTTLRDVCTEGAGFADIDLSKAVNSGFITGPRIVTSGKGIAANGWYLPFSSKQNHEYSFPSGTQYVSGHDECVKAVREQVAAGVQWIKLFADWEKPTFNYDEIKTVIDEANKFHINVAAHAISKEGIRMAIQAGARSIEHGDGFNDSLIKLAIEHHVYWCPTVTVAEYLKIPMDTIYNS
jgi:imidazolonepropionase-like amidohydrolase